MVEHRPVKAIVAGSSPASGARASIDIIRLCKRQPHEYLSTLQTAISGRTILEVHYKNNSEEVSKREIEAIGLIFYAYNWHLIAWCHVRNDYRDFRVSRILKMRNTNIPFRKADHVDINDYMKALPVNY